MLATIISAIVTAALGFLWGKIGHSLAEYLAIKKAREADAKQAEADRAKTEAATTKEERNDATQDLVNHF